MKKNTFLIAGKHSVEEALKNPLRKVSKVYLTEDAKRLINRSNQPLNLFQKVSTIFKTRRELNNLCGKDDVIHQGILAEVEPLEDINLKDFLIKNPKIDRIILIFPDSPRYPPWGPVSEMHSPVQWHGSGSYLVWG